MVDFVEDFLQLATLFSDYNGHAIQHSHPHHRSRQVTAVAILGSEAQNNRVRVHSLSKNDRGDNVGVE